MITFSGHFDFFKKTQNGTLRQNVYRKPSRKNLYLNNLSHHYHPAPKRLVMTTLVDRARKIADKDHINEELSFLKRDLYSKCLSQ